MANHQLDKLLSHNSQSFTLIEILITVAIIAVLMTVVVLAINPTEITKKARDTQRLTDMANLEMLLQLARSEGMLNTSYCDGTKIYASLPSETPLSNNNLPAGISWAQVSEDNIRKPDGTGWIPLNFKSLNYLQTSVLPVDPKNSLDNSLYYTFYCNPEREYILTAYPESQTFGPKGGQDSKTIGDGGPDPYVYEVGNNLFISPLKPVGSWSFDEGTGTIANDSSGNNNNGTLINGPTWADGQINKAISFDGVDDDVNCGNDESLNITDAITVELWMKLESVQNFQAIIDKYWPNGYSILVNWERDIRCYYSGGNSPYYLALNSGVNSFNWGEWTYIAYTFDWSVPIARVYVNAVQKNSKVPEGNIALNPDIQLRIGSSGGYYTKGLIDEVRIYNRALSAEEIQMHYEMSK